MVDIIYETVKPSNFKKSASHTKYGKHNVLSHPHIL